MRKVRFGFSKTEVSHLVLSAIILGFIIGYPFEGSTDLVDIAVATAYLTLVVGTAFIIHESAHKLTAQSYGCWSEFRMWKEGLGISLLLKIMFGTTLIVPGAAYYSPFVKDIWGRVSVITREAEGKISAAGPLANIALATLVYYFQASLGPLAQPAIYINLILALFNLIPFPPLDGYKVIRWNFWIWVGCVATGWIMLQRF